MTTTFQTTEREAVDAARAMILRQPSGWALHAIFLGMPVALAFYIAFLDPDPRPWNWWFVLGVLAFCGTFLYFFPWIPVRSLRKGQRDVDGPMTVSADERGLRVAAPHSSAEFAWGGILKHVETAQFILIYTGRNVAIWLPKRALPAEDLDVLRSLLAAKGQGPHPRA